MERRYDLDWIRVIATIAVFLYHCLMFFTPWPWHVKNNEIDSLYITVASLFMSTWLMPIFFVISGVSTYYVLMKSTGKNYLKQRLIRLGLPLLFGVMVLTPPQVYIERVTHGQFTGTFLAWFPQYFNGLYLDIGGEGNFAFVGLHLWYLFILLIFSLLTLPIFQKLAFVKIRIIKPIHLLLLSIPLIAVSSTVNLLGLGGWDITIYLVLFFYGYFIISKESFRNAVKKAFPLNIILAVITTFLFIYLFMTGVHEQGSLSFVFLNIVKVLNCWSWLLVIFHLADKYLSHSNSFLKYGSLASMPFYVLHQPIIVMTGFLIYKENWAIPSKLLFLIVIAFIVIMSLYHFVISKYSILSVLFGMKGKVKKNKVDQKPIASIYKS